ncbi:hypothetical protein J7T55_007709 [Diaporthe amygdali]|uniref:uncharacterized protein n=1 Tax=Phomopsis amygdali TaxID=1214568 RepID=UPI0022FE8297|nr:uncharacterized protein J7T55_007709 [Diaporthe amygdali]KAJ0107520.1 hypothetical protein J7T55_007709 [Diaporthe amygdali]
MLFKFKQAGSDFSTVHRRELGGNASIDGQWACYRRPTSPEPIRIGPLRWIQGVGDDGENTKSTPPNSAYTQTRQGSSYFSRNRQGKHLIEHSIHPTGKRNRQGGSRNASLGKTHSRWEPEPS